MLAVRGARKVFAAPAMMASVRTKSAIKFVNERGEAQENVYFRQSDDAVLKNLLNNHPEYDPKYATNVDDVKLAKLASDVSSVLGKYGRGQVNLALLKDLEAAFVQNGYKK